MNAEHPNTEQLQRGYDGDLSNQEAAELHRHLASCTQCQAEFDSIGRLGQLVRWAAGDAVVSTERAEPDWKRMFASIQNEITSTPPLVAAHVASRKKPHWIYRTAPALGAVALAAAAILMVTRQDTLPNDANAVATNENDVVLPTPGRSEVVGYDFGTNAGKVLEIDTSDGPAVPLVWIYDDDDDEDQPEE